MNAKENPSAVDASKGTTVTHGKMNEEIRGDLQAKIVAKLGIVGTVDAQWAVVLDTACRVTADEVGRLQAQLEAARTLHVDMVGSAFINDRKGDYSEHEMDQVVSRAAAEFDRIMNGVALYAHLPKESA